MTGQGHASQARLGVAVVACEPMLTDTGAALCGHFPMPKVVRSVSCTKAARRAISSIAMVG